MPLNATFKHDEKSSLITAEEKSIITTDAGDEN